MNNLYLTPLDPLVDHFVYYFTIGMDKDGQDGQGKTCIKFQ